MVKVGKGSTRVYQYTDPLAQLRSHRECFEFGKMALVQDEVRTMHACIYIHTYT